MWCSPEPPPDQRSSDKTAKTKMPDRSSQSSIRRRNTQQYLSNYFLIIGKHSVRQTKKVCYPSRGRLHSRSFPISKGRRTDRQRSTLMRIIEEMPVENKSSGESQWMFHPKDSLTDASPIVRYMSLSAFFLLLCGRAFLPSLKRLQEIDKFEGRLPNFLFPFVSGQHIKKVLESHEELEEFLLQNARGPRSKKFRETSTTTSILGSLRAFGSSS